MSRRNQDENLKSQTSANRQLDKLKDFKQPMSDTFLAKFAQFEKPGSKSFHSAGKSQIGLKQKSKVNHEKLNFLKIKTQMNFHFVH